MYISEEVRSGSSDLSGFMHYNPLGGNGQGNLEVLPAARLLAEVLINLMQRDPTVHMVTVDNVFGMN